MYMYIHEYGRRNVLSNYNRLIFITWIQQRPNSLFCKNCWLKVFFLNSANAGPNRINSVSAECAGLVDYIQEGSLADYTQEGSGNESLLR